MLDKKNSVQQSIENIFKVNLDIKKDEKVLVFTDDYNRNTRNISKKVSKAGKKYTDNIAFNEFTSTDCHGTEPPEKIWAEAFGSNVYSELKKKHLFKPLLSKKITKDHIKEIERIITSHKNESVDAVIALSYFSTSHTSFRDFLNRLCGARYASMPLFDEKMLAGPMRVNWQRMFKRTEKIADILNQAEEIEVHTSNGTSMHFSKKGRKALADTGIITMPGGFSNLPAGEVFLAPLEGTAQGKLVLEWAPTRKLKSPVTLHIVKGKVGRIEGTEKYADYISEKLSEQEDNANIAELGIGTNDRACRPDNILESEKIFGTIHIALGDNSSFGGKIRTSFHQDFVFFYPTVTLINMIGDRKALMKNGRLVRGLK